ncbi:MAG: 50S ribosomal protein L17 [Candidatus Magasanikbacteria bacterium CG10_big_fil_rev_8_21_14_0_10_47_10]|uniref:Large ribosomal subunit protein bL17 n=1 Tax=Candidatus Magasanikbacteria bacterium CG10_big_fil_rev_8_21_14_0_10_47_10 TaxID=1974652 RepID=A0A2H0TQF9_9BACT|nr:MAG: 50S ribosomal protein L17 [Candidatus Magasanikbacteria bacterium CG10_big_fil_rev_8_21_14_0_10_47_10]
MRHKKRKFTFGRETAQKKALLRGLATNLVLHGSIKTTTAKAKALRTVVEPLVTRARKGGMFNRQRIASVLYTREAVKKMLDEIGPKYTQRNGGYTRITKIGTRPNDGADMARIEFV